jgi:tight adherence protein B
MMKFLLIKWGSVALITIALFVVTYVSIADRESASRRAYERYLALLARQQRKIFVFSPPETVVVGQIVGVVVVIALAIILEMPLLWFALFAVFLGPTWYLDRQRHERVHKIEDQVDGFILALANALKTTPSIGDALKSVQSIIGDPIKQEVELVIKEMRVGSTLDHALLLMANRVGSRVLDTALSSVLVGQKVGGNLPKILETMANSLRQMKRLDGVVRTKTAEGKMQLWVLAIFPFAIVALIATASQGYFDPLTTTFTGYICSSLAVIFWIGSLVVARNILTVDI